MHGIMAAIAEFYSRNLGVEALKGATEKAKQGGTPYLAPIGYTNIIERINHRENRTVVLDTERAPLVSWAFERYATGDYSELRLAEELAKRGLRSRHRARSTVEPLSVSGLDKMLSNRYYMGFIRYCGVEYAGKHQPLVTPAVFAACQAVRANHSSYANKGRKHNHHLSRLLVCEKCGRHLCMGISKQRYPYFFCMNRRDKGCPQPYIPVAIIEREIANAFNQIRFSKAEQKELANGISEDLKNEIYQGELEIKRQKQRINRLQIEQENLLQSYYSKVIESDLMKKEQKRVLKDIGLAQSVMAEAEKRLSVINNRKDRALKLAQSLDFGETFLKANSVIKRLLCQALFSEIAVNDVVTYATSNENCRCVKGHKVSISINWHKPINIHRITEAILALSLEKGML